MQINKKYFYGLPPAPAPLRVGEGASWSIGGRLLQLGLIKKNQLASPKSTLF